MNSPFISCRGGFAAAMLGLMAMPLAGLAEDLTPPVVVKPIADLTVAAGTTQSVVNLKNTFGLKGVTGQVVRMATVAGNIDIEMLADDAPLNVANFLSYVNSGAYNKSFIHRSVPGFVIQGGGYDVTGTSTISTIPANAPVKGEYKNSNVRGTIATALGSGINSGDTGTNNWFFNLMDNTGLDVYDPANNDGPFTVFGRVIEGDMATVDAIAALPELDFSSSLGGAFTNLPLYNYDSSEQASVDNLVYVNDVAIVPLVPSSVGADAVLKLKAKVRKADADLVTATITGKKLKLKYTAGKTGTVHIKVLAIDSAGTQTKSQFTVTVK